MSTPAIETKKNAQNRVVTVKKFNLLNIDPNSKPQEKTINRKGLYHKTTIDIASPNKYQRSFKKKMTKRENTEEENRIIAVKEKYHKNRRSCTVRGKIPDNYKQEPLLPLNLVNKFTSEEHDERIYNLYHILQKNYVERSLKENNELLTFLITTKIGETIKSDLLITDLSVNELFQYFKQYMSINMYSYLDSIYYTDEESVNYYVLLKGEIGQYKLEMFEQEFTCEEYLIFLYDNYKNYESEKQIKNINGRKKSKIIIKHKENFENKDKKDKKDKNDKQEKIEKNEENVKEEYIDNYLLCHMIEENKDVFPLYEASDLTKIPKIILKIRLFMTLNEEQKPLNAQSLFYKYDIPLTYLSFDKCLYGVVSVHKYIQNLLSNFQERDHFYMRNFSSVKRKIKCYKYVKCFDNLKPFAHFGNFELVDCEPKREYTTRCESEYCVVLYFNKLLYSQVMYKLQKTKRENELEMVHNYSLFKNISQRVYVQKIFSKFLINNYFKGDVLFNQGTPLHNFIFIKEGIIELSLQNISLYEFNKLINYTKEMIIKKAKEYNLNPRELLDFNTEVEKSSTLNLKTRKEILFKRQNFLFQLSEKAFYGEIELFFKLNAILTATVASDKCLLYYYSYDKFKSLNEETFFINDNLKSGAFEKLKSLIKRMITVYNSYWLLSNEQVSKKLNDDKPVLRETKTTDRKRSPPMHIINPFTLRSFIGKNKGKNSNNEANNDLNTRTHKIINNYDNNIWSPKVTSRYPLIPSVNKNFQSNTVQNKKYKNKINISMQKPSDQNLFNEDKNVSFENDNKINTINNNGNYFNKLYTTFKNEMISQRSAPRNEHLKTYLPPILLNIPDLSNYQIFSNKNSNSDNSKNIDNDINYKTNSGIKRSISELDNQNINQKPLSDVKNEEKTERNVLIKKKAKSKINKHHKVSNFLVAQLNIMKYKANKNKKAAK